MYVYTTAQVHKKAEKFNLRETVNKLCKDTHPLTRLDRFGASHYYKRSVKNFRILAKVERVEEDIVLCLLDILQRGSNEYDKLLKDPIKVGEQLFVALIDTYKMHQWLEQQKESENQQPSQKPPLSQEMSIWLQNPGWEVESNDIVIYESEEWVTRFRTREIHDYWQTYYKIISDYIIGCNEKKYQKIPRWTGVILCEGEYDKHILFSKVLAERTHSRQVIFFLIAPFKKKPSDEEIIRVGQEIFFDQPQILATPPKLNELTRFARRAYPGYLLADRDSWHAIERGGESNLALSAEEEQVLKSVSVPEQNQDSLPIFINGRAGSGKSTMLIYLFADYCYRKYDKKNEDVRGDLLFLTYNGRLLEVAKNGVKKILESHSRFLVEGALDANNNTIDKFFHQFQKFLLNLLPLDRQELFDSDRYVSFHRFKKLYREKCNLPEAKKLDPEICWHVIRTFIKGYDFDEYTDRYLYEEINRKDRTVEVEEFETIYKTIWEKWYKKLTTEDGYWDDQDLVREAIKLKEDSLPKYVVVFCDEAQDFTRLELQLIMRLSIFSKYDLSIDRVRSLPFAFAGDPLQTLNPTGFRWSSLKASFHSEVIKTLDPTDRLSLGMNLQELKFNYRSSPQIVQATNIVQLWRAVLFNLSDIQPQMAWQQGDFPEPQIFVLGQNLFPDNLDRYTKDTITIVPCEEGGEVDYIKNDEVLSQVFVDASEVEPPKNVLSAVTAKGLEFKKVILYKFGEACDPSIWSGTKQDNEVPIKFQYFLNKLYVAASRAMERLFIVDSEKGYKQLWKYASQEADIEEFYQRSRNPDDWRKVTRVLAMGTSKTVQDMSEDDPELLASEFEGKGLEGEDPKLLRRAKQYFSMVGKSMKAKLCEAWALRFEEKFQEAGKRFLDLKKAEEARECFWKGMYWSDLVQWFNQYPSSGSIKQVGEIARFMQDNTGQQNSILEFTYFLETCIDNERLGKPLSKQWKYAIEQYAKRISGLRVQLPPDRADRFGQVLEALGKNGFRSTLRLSGDCFYQARNYQTALKCWEEGGNTQQYEYYIAKAETTNWPERLEWLSRAGETERIIEEWRKAGGTTTSLDPQALKYVASALEKQKNYTEAVRAYIKLDELERVQQCFEEIKKQAEGGAKKGKQNDVVSLNLIGEIVNYLILRNEWIQSIDIIEEYLQNKTEVDIEARLRCEIVRAIAYSDLAVDNITHAYSEAAENITQVKQRHRYEGFAKQVVSTDDWQKHLSPQEAGSTLERIGGLVLTLQFYERFIYSKKTELATFARERWIATKRKQAVYEERKQYDSAKAKDIRADIDRKYRMWNISASAELLPYPKLEAKDGDRIAVKGLPLNVRLERLDRGDIRFKLNQLEVQTRGGKSLLQIEDANFQSFKVNFKNRTVSGDAENKHEFSGNEMTFEVSGGLYSGAIVFDKKICVTLTIGESRVVLEI
ncbi:MAG: hypothetical protein F6J93_14105 [Oscillatoria sp. SIO1A7]|nr:hypothetical protein [Oscillatoria sp. SIO1A7]